MSDTKPHAALTAVSASLAPGGEKSAPRARWNAVSLRDPAAVEALLAWVASAGYREWRVDAFGGRFVVRWR
jgi:hypothetical protein